MTENKRTVEKYIEGFRKSDHEMILACLTDDIEWEMPGTFRLIGKEAFDKEIENDEFVGSPTMTITRMTEENDVVVAEGSVRTERKAGGFLNAVFCDVFVMQRGKNQTKLRLKPASRQISISLLASATSLWPRSEIHSGRKWQTSPT